MYTDDGGLTWTFGNSGVTETLDGVAIADGGTAFVVGDNGTALRSTDWGATWAPMTFPFITDPAFLDVSLWDDLNAIIVGAFAKWTISKRSS